LYGHETSSLAGREHNRLGIFKNKFPKKIFGPKEEEIMEACRKLQYEELYVRKIRGLNMLDALDN
jgi:hypothetical protein